MTVFVVVLFFQAWTCDAYLSHYFAAPELCTFSFFVAEPSSCVPFYVKRPSFHPTRQISVADVHAVLSSRVFKQRVFEKKKRPWKFLAPPSQSQESYFLPNNDVATLMLLDMYECVRTCVCVFRRIANIFKSIWLGNRQSVTVLTCNVSGLCTGEVSYRGRDGMID